MTISSGTASIGVLAAIMRSMKALRLGCISAKLKHALVFVLRCATYHLYTIIVLSDDIDTMVRATFLFVKDSSRGSNFE